MTSLSQEFVRRREERGWTIEDVSAKTRVRNHVIEAIEQGNFDILPAAYIRSYLKIYSQLVGMTDDELIVFWRETASESPQLPQLFAENNYNTLKPYSGETSNNNVLTPIKASKPIVASIVYSAFVLCVGVLVYYFFFYTKPSPTLSLKPGELVGTTEITDDSAKGGGMLNYFNASFPSDSIILEAQTTDTAWMTINMDGQHSQQITIVPSQNLRWSAKEYFILSLGNAGAISLKRNGQKLQKFGEKGSVVRQVKINAKEVIATSEPYTAPVTAANPATQQKSAPQHQDQSKTTSASTPKNTSQNHEQANTINKPALKNTPPNREPILTVSAPAQKNAPQKLEQAKPSGAPAQKNTSQIQEQIIKASNPPLQNINSQKVERSANQKIQEAAKPAVHTTDTHGVKSKFAKQQITQKQKLKPKKLNKQKSANTPSALQRIMRNTAKESKKQRPDITPVNTLPLKNESPKYQPPTVHPVDKKND